MSAETFRARDNRAVWFLTEGRVESDGKKYDESARGISARHSGNLERVPNRDLRLALELADAAQAANILDTDGKYKGRVTAVVERPNLCLMEAHPNEGYSEVYEVFPDDLYDQLKAALHENH